MTNVDITKLQLEQEIEYLKYLVDACEEQELTNEQFFLDFEDELNKLSVKNHDKC